MTGTPANFVIIGYMDENGQVLMTALSDVCRVSIDQDRERDEILQWGGSIVQSYQTHNNITVTAEARPEGMMHVRADDHATAWRRLFDAWTPPASAAGVADEDSQAAVNAHFTFNPPTSVPANKVGGFGIPGGGGGASFSVSGQGAARAFVVGGGGGASVSGHRIVYGPGTHLPAPQPGGAGTTWEDPDGDDT